MHKFKSSKTSYRRSDRSNTSQSSGLYPQFSFKNNLKSQWMNFSIKKSGKIKDIQHKNLETIDFNLMSTSYLWKILFMCLLMHRVVFVLSISIKPFIWCVNRVVYLFISFFSVDFNCRKCLNSKKKCIHNRRMWLKRIPRDVTTTILFCDKEKNKNC